MEDQSNILWSLGGTLGGLLIKAIWDATLGKQGKKAEEAETAERKELDSIKADLREQGTRVTRLEGEVLRQNEVIKLQYESIKERMDAVKEAINKLELNLHSERKNS